MDKSQRKVFSRNLKHYMVEKNFNQEDVARALGVSSSAVNHWCLGIASPRGESLVKLANLLGTTPSSMIGRFSFDTIDEESILHAFRMLSPKGKEKAMERMEELKQLYWFSKDE